MTKNFGHVKRAILVIVSGLAVLADCTLASAQDPCTGATLLRTELNSQIRRRETRTVSGFSVRVVKDDDGWEVQVFAPSHHARRENLLYPQRNWHGAFPNQVQPDDVHVFPDVRRVSVRGSSHAVCIHRLRGDQDKSKLQAGWLEVSWIE